MQNNVCVWQFCNCRRTSNDIDVCFDISDINKNTVEKNYSLLDRYEQRRFKEYLLVDVILKETENKRIIEWMKHDRSNNERDC
ncbi:MAG TPA: hypothetical protein VGI61_08795 [Parafilimonas sp.]